MKGRDPAGPAPGTTRPIQGKVEAGQGPRTMSACKRRHLGSLRTFCILQHMLFFCCL